MALERLSIDEPLRNYLDALVLPGAPLSDLYAETAGDEWAQMMTHPDLGRLLAVLVRASGGRAVLEIGTFVGVSATWMVGGLAEDGRIDSLEIDPERAKRAEAWFRRAGISDRVRVLRGPAQETLATLTDDAYDLAYIDADKTGYPDYLSEATRLVRSSGLIVADNVLHGGDVADAGSEAAVALRSFTRAALDDPRLLTSVLTVGDGVTVSVVL